MDRFFLYLDILGFADLVKENAGEKINDLYEVIASLHANNHDAFKVVVFSDTVVVYNINGGDTKQDAQYLIMYLCEFVRDLMHRLAGRGIFYRAVITHGDFTHYELKGIPCFFGNALVNAHLSEKQLKAIGLFIDKKISRFCHIFDLTQFNENYDFVYVTQALDELEEYASGGLPVCRLVAQMIEDTDSKWHMLPELHHISDMYVGSKEESFPDSVKLKYQTSWDLYCKKYPKITNHLLNNGQIITSVAPDVDWDEVFDRMPEDCSYVSDTKVVF